MMFTYDYIVRTWLSPAGLISLSSVIINWWASCSSRVHQRGTHWFMIHKVTHKLIHTFILYRLLISLAHFFWTNWPYTWVHLRQLYFELHITRTSFHASWGYSLLPCFTYYSVFTSCIISAYSTLFNSLCTK